MIKLKCQQKPNDVTLTVLTFIIAVLTYHEDINHSWLLDWSFRTLSLNTTVPMNLCGSFSRQVRKAVKLLHIQKILNLFTSPYPLPPGNRIWCFLIERLLDMSWCRVLWELLLTSLLRRLWNLWLFPMKYKVFSAVFRCRITSCWIRSVNNISTSEDFFSPLSRTISCYANRVAGKNGNFSALKSPQTTLFFCQNICGLILEFGTWAVKLIQSQWWSTTHCILCYFVSCSSCHLFNTFTFSSCLLKQKPMYLLLYDREWRQHFFVSALFRQQSGKQRISLHGSVHRCFMMNISIPRRHTLLWF